MLVLDPKYKFLCLIIFSSQGQGQVGRVGARVKDSATGGRRCPCHILTFKEYSTIQNTYS